MPNAKTRKVAPRSGEPILDIIFGPPSLLEGEDPDAYEALLAQVDGAVKPQDIVEQIWVRDFVDITWEIMRLRRLRARLIVSGYGTAIRGILEPQYGHSRASDISKSWLCDEDDTRQKFQATLKELGLTMDDVHARALACMIKTIGRVDHMIESAEHRRRLVFAEIGRRRETLARHLREQAKTIDAQLQREQAQALAHVRGAP